MRKLFLLGAIAMVGSACMVRPAESHDNDAPDVEYINMPGGLEGLPFASAVRVNHTVYLSGQIGNIPGSRDLAAGGVSGETEQTLTNINSVLEHIGITKAQIVKCTVFLADIADYAAVNTVYAEFFGDNPPARSAMAGSGLALGALVEIECIAVTGG
jgi:2-iminobutanoate/2-iminopropanoate deaminase